MPYGHIEIPELVQFLGVDRRRLEKMAQRREIPCQKIKGQFRFNRAEITEWLQQHMSSLDQIKLADMDAGITSHREVQPDDKIITPMLYREAISLQLPARTKRSAIKELVALAEKTSLLWDSQTLINELIEREKLCSTALDGQVAIPHPRRPQPFIIAEPILVIAISTAGICYGGSDGQMTDIFFMTCSQDDRHHIHTLARLCRMFHMDDFLTNIRCAKSVDEIKELVTDYENRLITVKN